MLAPRRAGRLPALGLAALLVSVVTLSPAPPDAAGSLTLYTDAELSANQARLTERFAFLLEKGLLAVMSADDRQRLAGVVVNHPLRGKTPLSVEAEVLRGMQLVTAPIEALKFIEDLSLAYAWRHRNGLSLEPMDEYLAMLKHRPDAFAGRPADPLAALGVPPRIWKDDRRVDDLSLRFRNSAWAFILAHELGHLLHGHPLRAVSPAEVQRQEEEADAFSVDLLARSDTIPMGMILWFQATAGYFPNRADHPDDAAYARWLTTEATHPVNGHRMRSLAAAMQRQAAAERDGDAADALRFIGARLEAIGEIVEDPEMQRYLRRCAEARSPGDLARPDDRPCF